MVANPYNELYVDYYVFMAERIVSNPYCESCVD